VAAASTIGSRFEGLLHFVPGRWNKRSFLFRMFRGTRCGTGTLLDVEIAMFHAEQERSKTPFLFRVPSLSLPRGKGRGTRGGTERADSSRSCVTEPIAGR
jgi:hypothetical protein